MYVLYMCVHIHVYMYICRKTEIGGLLKFIMTGEQLRWLPAYGNHYL